jgi:hypothetical protein
MPIKVIFFTDRPAARHRQVLSHNVSSTLRYERDSNSKLPINLIKMINK